METRFEAYLERNDVKEENQVIYRTFKKHILRFWMWYTYTFDEKYKYPYLNVKR
ncbi:hypothetical protein GCM10023163_02210 [Aestuariibaculum suncheonense]